MESGRVPDDRAEVASPPYWSTRLLHAVFGTDGCTGLRNCYAVPSTYGLRVSVLTTVLVSGLLLCYAVSGTDDARMSLPGGCLW